MDRILEALLAALQPIYDDGVVTHVYSQPVCICEEDEDQDPDCAAHELVWPYVTFEVIQGK